MNESPHPRSGPDVRLTQEEQVHIRSQILSHMEMHPAPEMPLSAVEKMTIREILIEFMRESQNFLVEKKIFKGIRFWMPHFVAVVVGVAFLGAGVSYAANDALPGDYLYSVKIMVVEKVSDAWIRSDTKRAERASERSIKRLEEVEALILRGEESQEVWDDAYDNTRRQMEESQKSIEELSAQGKSEEARNATKKFEQALKERKKSLDSLKKKGVNGHIDEAEKEVAKELRKVRALKENIPPDNSDKTKKSQKDS